nr:dna polymerase iota [Quercus suber]
MEGSSREICAEQYGKLNGVAGDVDERDRRNRDDQSGASVTYTYIPLYLSCRLSSPAFGLRKTEGVDRHRTADTRHKRSLAELPHGVSRTHCKRTLYYVIWESGIVRDAPLSRSVACLPSTATNNVGAAQTLAVRSLQFHHDSAMEAHLPPQRKDGRIIIHFDYDCFYAAVFEAANPSLKSLPLAVQQKQIIVTCNYEARRRGLYKLQLVTEAKKKCPDVIIQLGEDLTRFRNASKELYHFIKGFSWCGKVERLGFDEVWVDVTDMIDYNMETLNRHNLGESFFHLSRKDPTEGFVFDASSLAGHAYPEAYRHDPAVELDTLALRLHLGSHLAMHMRHQMEEQKGYTSTVGIATNKLISKLVGNLNKPKGQTTMMPPLAGSPGNVQAFMDDHEIGKIPGIGFKLALKLREFILQRPAAFKMTLVYGGTLEKVTVADARNHNGLDPEGLEKLLSGPGSPHGVGYKIWCLLHGVDDSEVSLAKAVPSQISIEDSYIRLDTMPELLKELEMLSCSLLKRMRLDLVADEEILAQPDSHDAEELESELNPPKKWLAHPKTLRLSTRPRQPLQPDGTRVRSFKRISHSSALPPFVFNLHDAIDVLAAKLVRETLLGMFKRLHPEKSGWNLSLVNLAVTNMVETAGPSKTASGRDIGAMFRRQDDVLRDFIVREDASPAPPTPPVPEIAPSDVMPDDPGRSDMAKAPERDSDEHEMEEEDGRGEDGGWDEDVAGGEEEHELCGLCGERMPSFAMMAHRRFHQPDAV